MNATQAGTTTGRWVRGAATLVLTVAIVAWIGRTIDGAAFVEALTSVQGWRLVWVATVASGVLLLRGVRASLLLPREAPLRAVLSAVAIGFVASVVTPLRMGVLVRPWLLQRRAGIAFGTGVAGIVAERLLDVIALLILLAGVGIAALPEGAGHDGGEGALSLETAGAVLGGAALGVLGVLAVTAWVGPDRLARLAGGAAAGGLRARIATLAATFAAGTRAVAADPVRTAGAAALTVVMWCAGLVSAAVVLSGFDAIPAGPGLVATFFAAVMAANAAVPTPGSMGAYEAAGMAALALFGVDGATAVAAAVSVHLMSLVGQGVVGVVFVARDGTGR
ncbi:MAG: flippase-like domain-containing protein [Alphaproteobacteria bacterium]|nr:flippase-like domain-containing protein [Alphaproteobacteria bacterium]